MWREEFGLVEMLFTYIGDFAQFESYADWRPVLVDILTSHEEVRRRRLAEAIEYSSGERMKDDEVDVVYETRQPSGSGYASLQIPTEERSNAYSQSLMEYTNGVNREDDNYFIESNIMLPMTSECVNDTIDVEDDVMVKEEIDAQRSESQISEESIVSLEMETRGDTLEIRNLTGASEISNVNAISERDEQEIRYHQTNKTFKCAVCGKSFVSKKTFIRHMKRYYEMRSYRCDKCDKSFFWNADLKRHLRVHSGERPFKCNLCSKAFSTKANLKAHVQRIHFDERPFPCQLCERAFHTKTELKCHMKTWHNSQVTVP